MGLGALLLGLVPLAPGALAPPTDGCGSCLTDAAVSRVLFDDSACAPGRAAHIRVVAYSATGMRILAGGDLLTVQLCESAACDRGGVYPLEAIDRCDGTYHAPIPCAALPSGQYHVRVTLDNALRRDELEPAQWFCGSNASAFRGWDRLTYNQLRKLYACAEGRAVGAASGRRLSVFASVARPAAASARCEASFARAAHPARTDARELAPIFVPCTPPQAAQKTMLFDQAEFHHCLATSDGECVLEPSAELPSCLQGKRVSLVGDSVVEAAQFDVLHMWGGHQRNRSGAPIDKLAAGYCKWDGPSLKWIARVRKAPRPKANVSGLCAAPDDGLDPCPHAPTTLSYLNLRQPFRRGIPIFLKATSWQAIELALAQHDVVILESSRHDLAQVLPFNKYVKDKRSVLGAYRNNALRLARRLKQAVARLGLRTRVVWRTAVPPPPLHACSLTSNNLAIVQIANEAAISAFRAEGLEVMPLHRWVAHGAYHPRWWPRAVLADLTEIEDLKDRKGPFVVPTDVHTHEGWCPRVRQANAELGSNASAEQLGHRYGWLSKTMTQLTMHALCWQRRAR